jgi:hypothetical protein
MKTTVLALALLAPIILASAAPSQAQSGRLCNGVWRQVVQAGQITWACDQQNRTPDEPGGHAQGYQYQPPPPNAAGGYPPQPIPTQQPSPYPYAYPPPR